MSYFLGSKRYDSTVWGSRDLLSGVNRLAVARQSSSITDDRRFLALCQPAIVKILPRKSPELTGVYAQSPWDVFSQDSSSISKIASTSASKAVDFLRLAFNLFSKTEASGNSSADRNLSTSSRSLVVTRALVSKSAS